jgi:hypothetical protein
LLGRLVCPFYPDCLTIAFLRSLIVVIDAAR